MRALPRHATVVPPGRLVSPLLHLLPSSSSWSWLWFPYPRVLLPDDLGFLPHSCQRAVELKLAVMCMIHTQ
jgi:hypothetical protein